MNERLRIALPTGELENDVLSLARAVGLDFPEAGRKYLISVTNMPIDFVIFRSNEIPAIVNDKNSSIKVGITGSDLIWDAGMDPSCGQELPVEKLLGKDRISSVFIAVTEEFRNKVLNEYGREPSAIDLSTKTIVTRFPFITKCYCEEKRVSDPKIKTAQGKTEAIQYAFWDAFGLVDVVNTGLTLKANGFYELERFHEVSIRIIENVEGLSKRGLGILNELKEKIYSAENNIKL
jgi:ATP phosphoribosyltransferase